MQVNNIPGYENIKILRKRPSWQPPRLSALGRPGEVATGSQMAKFTIKILLPFIPSDNIQNLLSFDMFLVTLTNR